MKKILIIGISGQDGINLLNILPKNKYLIIGTTRNILNTKKKLLQFSNLKKVKIFNENFFSLKKTETFLLKHKPDLIFFLGGQSSVGKSFIKTNETINSNILPIINILETIRKFELDTKIYNSSSSEIFGNQNKKKLIEEDDFFPISPYGLSKAISTNLIRSYRDSFDIKAYNGICFNHESEQRNKNFLFGKLRYFIKNNKKIKKLKFGNLNVVRDWGLSKEYVHAFLKIASSNKPDDYIVATGKSYSIKDIFIKLIGKKNFYKKISMDKKNIRKNEIFFSYANPSKIKKRLNWKAQKSIINIFDNEK